MGKQHRHKGLTLVETLISLLLMSTVILSITMFVMKSNVQWVSYGYRNRGVAELDSLFGTMRMQIKNATWVDPASFKDKIILTTNYPTGTYINVGYRLTTAGGNRILQYSPDGGTTWTTPYSISADTIYRLDANSEFLFCGFQNNCTRFTDTDADGGWETGEGATLVSGPGSALSKPANANKIRLADFTFNRAGGNPPINRTWPASTLSLPDLKVAAGTAVLQSFVTQSGVGDFAGAAFGVRGLTYDPEGRRLIVVGTNTGTKKIFFTSRDGVRTRSAISTSPSADSDDVCLMPDGQTAILANFTAAAPAQIYTYNVSGSSPTGTLLTLGATGLTSGSAIACDPADSTYFYLVGKTAGGVTQIKQIKASDGTVGSSWSPSGITNTVTAMVIGPVSANGTAGDFYMLDSGVTVGPPRTMSIVRVARATPATTDPFTINLTNIGATTVTGASNLGLALDPYTNTMFLSDGTSNKVYEFIPPRLLTNGG